MPDVASLPNNRASLRAVGDRGRDWRFGVTSTLAAGRGRANGTHRGGGAVHDVFAEWWPESDAMAGAKLHLGVDNLTTRPYPPATWATVPAPGRNVKLTPVPL